MRGQAVLRWHTHRPEQPETAWRDAISRHVPEVPWDHLSLHQGNSALSLIARSAQGSTWLREHIGVVSRVVMQRMGGVITMEPLDWSPSLRHGGGRLYTYEAPTVVVSKGGPEWAAVNGDTLGSEVEASLVRGFEKQILEQLQAFAEADEEKSWIQASGANLALRITSAGRPMPIKVSLPNAQSGQRADRWMMCRLDMRLESAWRLEGDFAVGKLVGLGYGRVFRGDVTDAVARSREAVLVGDPA